MLKRVIMRRSSAFVLLAPSRNRAKSAVVIALGTTLVVVEY
jgi:hypothetical protein